MTARLTQQYVEAGVQPDAYHRRLTQIYVEVGVLEESFPEVTTSAATDITSTSATINGDLTTLGDEAAVDVSFEWKEQGAAEWNATVAEEKTETGAYSKGISDLDPDTTYEFRAVVEWDSGASSEYGSTLTLKTLGGAVSGAGLFFCHG